MKTDIEPYYMRQAEDIVDLLFDKGYFGEVKRKDMRDMEEYIAFVMQCNAKSAVKASELLRSLNK